MNYEYGNARPFSVLELFSGIGGMHAALNEIGLPFEVVDSYEINPAALSIYYHNFGKGSKMKEKNIMGLSSKALDGSIDLLVMSPPCQPFTRQGLKKDSHDKRCLPLLHILSLLENVEAPPPMILLENVAGFESSNTHSELMSVIQKKGYLYQEFLLTPSDFGIPNSRLRYYLIAKLPANSFGFQMSSEICSYLPVCTCFHSKLPKDNDCVPSKCCSCSKLLHRGVSRLIHRRFSKFREHIKEESFPLNELNLSLSSFMECLDRPEPYLVRQRDLLKYGKVYDIVTSESKGSCCFTKGYGHYVRGTGSVIHSNSKINLHRVFKDIEELPSSDSGREESLLSLRLRYFTPREILRLMCFPESFKIDESCSLKQSFRALGNSINVFVVSLLLSLLLEM